MPFTSTLTLPPSPVVRIFFSGQLILHSPPGRNICEVNINRSAPDHIFSVEVRGKRDNIPDVVLMRHFGSLAFTDLPQQPTRTHGMYIQLRGGGAAGVMRYDGGRAGASSALSDALNLVTLHDTANPRPSLRIDERGGRPSISIDGGVFYSALKTERRFRQTKPNTATTTTETGFASLIGAAIEGNAEIIWTQDGQRQSLPLRPDDRFQRFEIYVTNDPLYDDEQGGNGPPHDEFDEYYKILPDVQSHQKCTFKAEPLPAVPPPPIPDSGLDRGSARTPCMPVVIDPES